MVNTELGKYMMQRANDKRLVVFSAVEHHTDADHSFLLAHGGFVREIDIWARIFKEVVVAAPLTTKPPLADTLPYTEANITHYPTEEHARTSGLQGKLRLVWKMPQRLLAGRRLVEPDDIIMARGPESAGFTAVLLTRLLPNMRFARYVDQWQPFPEESFFVRLQKRFYAAPSFGGPVMIYGKRDAERPHLVPFFTSSISRQQWQRAGDLIQPRQFTAPFNLLFVGRFIEFKRADLVLKALRQLLDRGLDVRLDMVGDGDLRGELEALTTSLNLQEHVQFHGWVGWQDLEQFYARAHCFIHSSRKEGYGKVLLEAMTFAVPVVGTDVGVSQAILRPPEAGVLVPAGDASAIATAIADLLADPQAAEAMGQRGRERMTHLLLEDLETQYRQFVVTHLQLAID